MDSSGEIRWYSNGQISLYFCVKYHINPVEIPLDSSVKTDGIPMGIPMGII